MTNLPPPTDTLHALARSVSLADAAREVGNSRSRSARTLGGGFLFGSQSKQRCVYKHAACSIHPVRMRLHRQAHGQPRVEMKSPNASAVAAIQPLSPSTTGRHSASRWVFLRRPCGQTVVEPFRSDKPHVCLSMQRPYARFSVAVRAVVPFERVAESAVDNDMITTSRDAVDELASGGLLSLGLCWHCRFKSCHAHPFARVACKRPRTHP
jgi:hypothetical protein